jgi:thiol-disulfide isomerase/thioredoxin
MAITKITLLLIFTFSLSSTFSPVNGQDITGREYFITGTVKGIDSGTVRMLSSDGNKPINSALIVDGTFSMKGKIVMPERLLFNISPGNWNFRAFVEDTNIKLLVDTTGALYQGKGTNKWALIWEIEETGSAFADIYEEYIKATNQQYYAAIISSLREKNKAVKDDTVASAKINLALDSLRKLLLAKQKAWIENYIGQNPVSIAGVYIFNEYFQNYRYFQPSTQTTLSYLDFTLKRFAGIATTSRYYKELAEIAHNLRNVQQEHFAPDFTLLQRDNSSFTLSSTRGKYTLIDFWASWCLPCRKAIPFWKELYFKYKDKGFAIVGVSGDRKLKDWTQALDDENMSWVQVIDKFPDESKPSIVTESFGIYSLPYYILLDKEGKVIISSNDKNIVNEKIEEIFHR